MSLYKIQNTIINSRDQLRKASPQPNRSILFGLQPHTRKTHTRRSQQSLRNPRKYLNLSLACTPFQPTFPSEVFRNQQHECGAARCCALRNEIAPFYLQFRLHYRFGFRISQTYRRLRRRPPDGVAR